MDVGRRLACQTGRGVAFMALGGRIFCSKYVRLNSAMYHGLLAARYSTKPALCPMRDMTLDSVWTTKYA